jgi:uncharacterized protein
MGTWIMATEGGVLLHLKVQPGARVDAFMGVVPPGILKLKIKARPVDGKANAGLISFISTVFSVSKRAISIKSGEKSREKWVNIQGVSADFVMGIVSSS